MSSKKFRFVSPGVYVSEIDKSQLSAVAAGIGPVVIGRASRGPSMIPVTVNDYSQFVQLFGEPTRGNPGEDIWRTGETTSPLYGTYAARAFLRNSGPLTFVRLVGDQSPNANSTIDVAQAGWDTQNGSANTSTASNGGAFGLFVVPSGSLTSVTGTLAAVWYLNNGAIKLVGNDVSGNLIPTNSGAGVLVRKNNNGYEFRAQILKGDGSSAIDTSFNFIEGSSKYIRKVFNTNPTLANSATNTIDVEKNYWLGETFASYLTENVSEANGLLGFILPLQSGSFKLNDFRGKAAQSAKSGWVISQDLNTITGSYSAENMTKLFRLVASETAGGEWEQKNIKISITDIKPSTNDFYKFGSFTVQVRSINDVDSRPSVLETFTGCTLDPNSADYIANKIGDEYLEWDAVNKKYNRFGNYPRNSTYIRVEMNPLVEQGAVAEELLPFGFFGPPVFNDAVLVSGSVPPSSIVGAANAMPFSTAGLSVAGLPSGASMKIVFPTMKLLVSASSAGTPDARDAFYGAVFNIPATTRLNEDIVDLVRAKPDGIDSYDPQTGITKASFVFSLDEIVVVSGSSGESSTLSFWQSGSRAGVAGVGTSKTALAASVTSGSTEGYKSILEFGVDSFTMPLFGATDALNLREKEPFRNSLINSNDTEENNAVLYTLKKAVDTVKDPDVLNSNLLVMPGVTNKQVTSHMIEVCENRGDTLAIIDLPGGYVPSHENNLSETSRKGSVNATVNDLRSRGINSSYACTYYPWVKISDPITGLPLWVPPSVVALGTMASSQENSEIWFAPAGFNRGGLSFGSSGLTVLDVREKLTTKERDKLYENNINPIASFPNEGIVIFGQKTLQVTPSALDRINVRRLMIFLKKQISIASNTILFDQNVQATWDRFISTVEPFLRSVQSRLGITEYRLVLDTTTTTPDLVDRNILYAKIYIKPARAIEFIALDFVITRTGASFDD
jgi:hypothetical protein